MTYSNAVAAAYIATNGVIDKLVLETNIPGTHRTFLINWKAKLAANKSTTKSDDRRMLNIQSVWMIQRHKITA
jgi:hypothetical protein